MNKRLIALFLIILFLLFALIGLIVIVMRQSNGLGLGGSSVKDYSSLVAELRQQKGAENVTVIGDSPNDLFSVKPQRISIGNEQVDIYEFSNKDQADTEAARVSKDGTEIKDYGKVDWKDPAHFYQKDKLIVLYVGKDKDVIDLLNNTLGNQFAGGDF